jgi:hypothetical protein
LSRRARPIRPRLPYQILQPHLRVSLGTPLPGRARGGYPMRPAVLRCQGGAAHVLALQPSVHLESSHPFLFASPRRPPAPQPGGNEKRRPKPASLSGFLCLLARWLAQHSPPDVRADNVKREEDTHSPSGRAPLLASHDVSIIGGACGLSRPCVLKTIRRGVLATRHREWRRRTRPSSRRRGSNS